MINTQEPELNVIGALCIDPACAENLCRGFSREDFTIDYCRDVFDAFAARRERRDPIDPVLLAHDVETKIPDATEFLRGCIHATCTTANLRVHSELVHFSAELRRMQERVFRCFDECSRPEDAASRLIEIGQTHLRTGAGNCTRLKDGLAALYFSLTEEAAPPLKLGFEPLDTILGGLHPGEFCLLAARPAVGKSALALQIADQVALQGHTALYVSMEMPTMDLVRRLACNGTGLTSEQLHPGPAICADNLHRLSHYGVYAAEPLFFSDEAAVTVSSLRAMAHRVEGLEFLAVDYISLMVNEPARRSRFEDVSEISRKLKMLAMELNIPILVLAQLNRERDEDERPGLTNLRDSGSLEQDADKVMLLWRQERESRTIVCRVAKNRSGRTGAVQFDYCGERFHYENCRPWDGNTQPPGFDALLDVG